jgi:hypothetical protein
MVDNNTSINKDEIGVVTTTTTVAVTPKDPIDAPPCDTEKPGPSKIWMRDSQGNPSATLTFVTITFWLTAFAYIVSVVTKIGPIEFRPFDSTACLAFFGSTASLYWGRRFVSTKYGESSPSG